MKGTKHQVPKSQLRCGAVGNRVAKMSAAQNERRFSFSLTKIHAGAMARGFFYAPLKVGEKEADGEGRV